MSERFKILPLLIIVAMLAFSVRLVEVVSGVRDLSGGAFAASEANNRVDQEEELAKLISEAGSEEAVNADDSEELVLAAAETEDEMVDAPENEIDPPPMDESQWRDSSDTNYDLNNVKMEMFKDMAARREELDKRERALVTREALLRAAEQEIDRKYQEMAELKNEIESLLEDQSEEEEARIKSLVKIYEGMKPKEAARIFDTLDLDVLVSVLSRMSERKLSPILAAMNPERARTVTIVLAEEKKLPELPEN